MEPTDQTITLNKANPRFPVYPEDIEFRGCTGLIISEYDFKCRVQVKFHDFGGDPSATRDLIKGVMNRQSIVFAVDAKSYDFVYFELTNVEACMEDTTFSVRFSKTPIVSYDYAI